MLSSDRDRALYFGADAERYDRARPGYPTALVDAVLADHPHAVLDVGCGTGIAAQMVTDRGCAVLGVEPDRRMAAVGRSRGLTVEISTFEAWDPANRRFDLLTSAQAWHWVDPQVGPPKAAELLRSGGRIALFWNRGTPPRQLTRMLDDIYARHAPEVDTRSVLLGNLPDDTFASAVSALEATGVFREVRLSSFDQKREYTTGTWLDELPTHSNHRNVEPHRLEALLKAHEDVVDRLGGRFVMRYETVLVSARRS